MFQLLLCPPLKLHAGLVPPVVTWADGTVQEEGGGGSRSGVAHCQIVRFRCVLQLSGAEQQVQAAAAPREGMLKCWLKWKWLHVTRR